MSMTLTERFSLLLDADTRTDLAAAADGAHQTVNQWVRQAIREKLERDSALAAKLRLQ
jgi:predicted HicB family RNase H-like nuclease